MTNDTLNHVEPMTRTGALRARNIIRHLHDHGKQATVGPSYEARTNQCVETVIVLDGNEWRNALSFEERHALNNGAALNMRHIIENA